MSYYDADKISFCPGRPVEDKDNHFYCGGCGHVWPHSDDTDEAMLEWKHSAEHGDLDNIPEQEGERHGTTKLS